MFFNLFLFFIFLINCIYKGLVELSKHFWQKYFTSAAWNSTVIYLLGNKSLYCNVTHQLDVYYMMKNILLRNAKSWFYKSFPLFISIESSIKNNFLSSIWSTWLSYNGSYTRKTELTVFLQIANFHNKECVLVSSYDQRGVGFYFVLLFILLLVFSFLCHMNSWVLFWPISENRISELLNKKRLFKYENQNLSICSKLPSTEILMTVMNSLAPQNY